MPFKPFEVDFRLTGTRSAIMHADDIAAHDEVEAWIRDPRNKNLSKKGDDRTPAWTWQTYLYHDGTHLACPWENLAKSLAQGAARKILNKQTTFKEVSQSGIVFSDTHYEFRTKDEKRILLAPILAIHDEPFPAHVETCRGLGFDLFIKRAKPEGSKGKHVRVRPIFAPGWTVRGTVSIEAEELTMESLQEIWSLAGKRGLFDWRPSSPKSPGPYGVYTVELKRRK